MSASPLAPAVAAYPTRCGIWLIPDTPDGRDLMATVKVGPHTSRDGLPDFDPFLVQVILGVLAALTLWAAFAMGAPHFGLIATLLAAGAIGVGVETRRIRADERRLRASGLAMPLPEQLWGRPMPTSDPARSRRRDARRLEELQALPAVEGVPALTLVWLAAQEGATQAAVDTIHAAAQELATRPQREEMRRQEQAVRRILDQRVPLTP